MTLGVFAGIPVSDFTTAVAWYERLLGTQPTFYPHDTEAVWQLAADSYVYVVEDAQRAGGAISMIWVEDPVSEVARIAGSGLEPVDVEQHDQVKKYVFHDADGNQTGIGGEVAAEQRAGRTLGSRVPTPHRGGYVPARTAGHAVRRRGGDPGNRGAPVRDG